MYDQDPVDYILAQVKENVKYLQSKGRVSESAANQINDLLAQQPAAAATRAAPAPMAAPVRAPTFSPPPSTPQFRAPPPPQVQPQVQHVRALYDYNAPGDLNFRTGDVIELVPSPNDNDDWWTGRLNGQTALFPSNYVERIAAPPSAGGPMHRLPPPPAMSGPSSPWNEKPPMQSYNSAPPFTGYPSQPGNPAADPSTSGAVQQQQVEMGPDGQPIKKKNKFGKIGSTVGNAAAGGLGFGAGAAIGGGIINAIF